MPLDRELLEAFDRAAHLRKDVDFLERELRSHSSLLLPVWRDLNLIEGGRLARLPLRDRLSLLELGGELVWLGRMDTKARGSPNEHASCFALDLSPMTEPLAHPALAGTAREWKDLRFIGAALPAGEASMAAYARGILHWHSRQQHCGRCGHGTAPRQGGHLRICRNEACATEHFPRTDPAIIVLVSDGEDCLLGRQRRWPKGMYSTLAGFVEPGESIEEAVAREVEEEAGVRVQDVRYFRSQPWPFPSSLMIGFMARASSRELRLGDDELEDAAWFSRTQLRAHEQHGFFVPGSYSLAGQLIAAFLSES